MKDYREVLDETIKVFNLKGSDLAAASGVAPEDISRLRRKRKDVTTARLTAILHAMPAHARLYFICKWVNLD